MLMFKAAEELRSQARSRLDIAADIARISVGVTGFIALLFGAFCLMGGVSLAIAAAFRFVSSHLFER